VLTLKLTPASLKSLSALFLVSLKKMSAKVASTNGD
jgi:hypothetical protein